MKQVGLSGKPKKFLIFILKTRHSKMKIEKRAYKVFSGNKRLFSLPIFAVAGILLRKRVFVPRRTDINR